MKALEKVILTSLFAFVMCLTVTMAEEPQEPKKQQEQKDIKTYQVKDLPYYSDEEWQNLSSAKRIDVELKAKEQFTAQRLEAKIKIADVKTDWQRREREGNMERITTYMVDASAQHPKAKPKPTRKKGLRIWPPPGPNKQASVTVLVHTEKASVLELKKGQIAELKATIKAVNLSVSHWRVYVEEFEVLETIKGH